MARPRKTVATRRVGLAVYLEPAIIKRLKEAADKDRRSSSTLAGILIERGLAALR